MCATEAQSWPQWISHYLIYLTLILLTCTLLLSCTQRREKGSKWPWTSSTTVGLGWQLPSLAPWRRSWREPWVIRAATNIISHYQPHAMTVFHYQLSILHTDRNILWMNLNLKLCHFNCLFIGPNQPCFGRVFEWHPLPSGGSLHEWFWVSWRSVSVVIFFIPTLFWGLILYTGNDIVTIFMSFRSSPIISVLHTEIGGGPNSSHWYYQALVDSIMPLASQVHSQFCSQGLIESLIPCVTERSPGVPRVSDQRRLAAAISVYNHSNSVMITCWYNFLPPHPTPSSKPVPSIYFNDSILKYCMPCITEISPAWGYRMTAAINVYNHSNSVMIYYTE